MGAFYVYAYSEMVFGITPDNTLALPRLNVLDCSQAQINLIDFVSPGPISFLTGRVHFGGDGSEGFTPCGLVPTRPSTWGRLRSMYRDEE